MPLVSRKTWTCKTGNGSVSIMRAPAGFDVEHSLRQCWIDICLAA